MALIRFCGFKCGAVCFFCVMHVEFKVDVVQMLIALLGLVFIDGVVFSVYAAGEFFKFSSRV